MPKGMPQVDFTITPTIRTYILLRFNLPEDYQIEALLLTRQAMSFLTNALHR